MIRDKIIGNSLHVKDILRNLSKVHELEATILFSVNDLDRGILYYYRKDKQLFFKLNEEHKQYSIGLILHVSFLLKETVFSFETTVINITDNILELVPPVIFTSSFKRHYSRYAPSSEEKLIIKLPDGTIHEVKDITTSGVAFYSEKLDYEIGDRIRNMYILLQDDYVCLDADVKYIIEADNGDYFYGTEFINHDWFSHNSLFKYIFSNTYSDIRQITDYSKEEVYLLYENSDYFKLKPRDEIEEAFNKMHVVLHHIKNYPQVITNPVFVHNNKLYMGASALRIYNRTFLAQHLAAIPESKLFPSSKSSIYLGLSDYLICNPYYSFYLTYFNAHNKWHNRMYGSIAGYINDEKKYLYDTMDYFECYLNEYESRKVNEFTAAIIDDPADFCSFAAATFSPLVTATYGYNKNNIHLDEIKQLYEIIGLYAARNIIKVEKNGRVVAWAVCEAYTAGLNLYNVLDLLQIFIIDKTEDLNMMFDSIIKEAKYFYDKYEKAKFNVFVKLDEGIKDTIEIPGLHYDFLVGRGIVDRSGIIEYKNLIMNMSR